MPGLLRTYPDLSFNFIKRRALSPPLNYPCPADLLAVKSDSAAEPSNISAPQLFTDLNCEMPEDSGVESSVQRICPWQRVRPCGARLGLSHLCSFSQLQPLSSPSVIFHLQSQSSLIGLILHLVTVFNKKVLFKEKIFISLQLWYVCGRNDCVTIVSSVVWEIESTKWEWHQINKCPNEVSSYWAQCFVKAILLVVKIWNKLDNIPCVSVNYRKWLQGLLVTISLKESQRSWEESRMHRTRQVTNLLPLTPLSNTGQCCHRAADNWISLSLNQSEQIDIFQNEFYFLLFWP